jgi:hypothetical protein
VKKVFTLVLKRCANSEIAEELYFTLYAIESHVTSILRKLGLKSRSEISQSTVQLISEGDGERICRSLSVSSSIYSLQKLVAGASREARSTWGQKLAALFVEAGFALLLFDRGFDLAGVGERHVFDVDAAAVVDLDAEGAVD